MKLIYDTKKEKKAEFQSMWKQIFGDPDAYEAFYFDTVYEKNQVIYAKKDQEIVGMIHLNPYEIQVADQSYPLHYIVGVATKKSCRRQGIMRQMLLKVMEDMAQNGEIFTYLMPANKAYYEPFDFAFVQSFTEKEEAGKAGESALRPLAEEEIPQWISYQNAICSRKYLVYTKADVEYVKQLKKECDCEDGDLLIWKEGEAIKGICCYGKDGDDIYIRQIFTEDRTAMKEQLSMYFYEKCLKLTMDAGDQGDGASIMVRILRLDLLLPLISAKSQKKICLTITDAYLPEQNGTFSISLSPKGCSIERTPGKKGKEIGIWNLTKILFGYECDKLLEEYPELQDVIPLSPVMIGEIV